jgi:2-phospho-L-lactate guanylyltransferase
MSGDGPRTAAIVPVKSLAAAKGRLREMLSPAEREELTLWMLDRVLRALRESPAIDSVYVVTPDARVLAFAAEAGATPLQEREHSLNAALEEARREAVRAGARACLVALGDLPLLEPGDVSGMLEVVARTGGCAVAPDRHGTGTNLLLLRPTDALPLLFGAHSLQRFTEAARAREVPLVEVGRGGAGFDVDTPDDLRELRARGVEVPVLRGLALAACGADGER